MRIKTLLIVFQRTKLSLLPLRGKNMLIRREGCFRALVQSEDLFEREKKLTIPPIYGYGCRANSWCKDPQIIHSTWKAPETSIHSQRFKCVSLLKKVKVRGSLILIVHSKVEGSETSRPAHTCHLKFGKEKPCKQAALIWLRILPLTE